jgi:aminobenzoyl-glutamate utilization protein B
VIRSLPFVALVGLVGSVLAPAASAQKEELYESIRTRGDASWSAARQIWAWAEPGYQEVRSSELLATMLKEAGFRVTREVAGIPTAFTAEYGEGRPIIGILGEYDALPGLSQQAVPHRALREDVTYGHGCGHHVFGVASVSASIAIAEQIQAGNLKGTVRFYGCPAEEGGSAKAFMVREGLFADVDAVLHWHPGSSNSAGDRSSLARIAVKFRFHGVAAHAAGAPEQGRSALDAVELTNHAAELLREHTPEDTRIHHVVTAGGEAPNVVPAFAEVYYYVRHPKSEVLKGLYARLLKCAEGAALATETKLELVEEGGIAEILPNTALAQVTLRNLRELNDLEYDASELEFALRLQGEMMKPEPIEKIKDVADRSGTVGDGSTDVGDVSWVTPTTGFSTACWVPGTPGHSWLAVACGDTTIARKGMDLAARVLAATCWDLMTTPELLKEAQAEQARRRKGAEYQPLIRPDQKPPLDYRKPYRGIGPATE